MGLNRHVQAAHKLAVTAAVAASLLNLLAVSATPLKFMTSLSGCPWHWRYI